MEKCEGMVLEMKRSRKLARRRARENPLTTGGWVAIGLGAAVVGGGVWYFFLRDPSVQTFETGKTYNIAGPTSGAVDPTVFATGWIGWSNVTVTFFNNQGMPPTGALLKAATAVGFTPANGYVINATRTGPATPLVACAAVPV